MLPVGASCFYQAHFGRTVLPKWPFWAHLFYSVFYHVSELRRACFRQARVARAMLPPGALFRAGAFALPPCAPKSHMRPLPHLGVSERSTYTKGNARWGVFLDGLRLERKSLQTQQDRVSTKKAGELAPHYPEDAFSTN